MLYRVYRGVELTSFGSSDSKTDIFVPCTVKCLHFRIINCKVQELLWWVSSDGGMGDGFGSVITFLLLNSTFPERRWVCKQRELPLLFPVFPPSSINCCLEKLCYEEEVLTDWHVRSLLSTKTRRGVGYNVYKLPFVCDSHPPPSSSLVTLQYQSTTN